MLWQLSVLGKGGFSAEYLERTMSLPSLYDYHRLLVEHVKTTKALP